MSRRSESVVGYLITCDFFSVKYASEIISKMGLGVDKDKSSKHIFSTHPVSSRTYVVVVDDVERKDLLDFECQSSWH